MDQPMEQPAQQPEKPLPDDQPPAPRGTCSGMVEVLKLALIVAAVFGAAWLSIAAWVIYEMLHR